MTERSVDHESFTIERRYDAPPARVFAAWADPAQKRRWFGGPDAWNDAEIDFRVGGWERSSGSAGGSDGDGPVFSYDALYQDIVPDERILYTYAMCMNGARISVSLACIELSPDGSGTRLRYTEHGAFLDGLDNAKQRDEGTEQILDALGTYLASG